MSDYDDNEDQTDDDKKKKKTPYGNPEVQSRFNDLQSGLNKSMEGPQWFKNLRNYLKPKGLDDQKIEQ